MPQVEFLLLEVRAEALQAEGNQFLKFLRNVGFYLTTRYLSVVQVELSSGYLDCFFWSLGNWSSL